MSIKLPIPLIQAVNAKISGVNEAPVNYSRSLDTLRMPIAICFPGEGTTEGNRGLRIMYRQYLVDVFVEKVPREIFDEPLQLTMDLIDEFVETWSDRANDDEDYVLDYGDESGYRIEVDRSKNITDSGWRMDLEWKPEEYHFGFRLTLPIMVRWGTKLL
jgi:hypothetical protein